MKLLFTLFLFSFFAVNSLNCQVKLHSPEYLNPDTNILLLGYNNNFEIKGLAKFKSYEVHSKYHRIIDTLKNKKITILVNSPFKNEIDTISIFQNDKLVFKKAFKVIPMIRLVVTIGQINDTSATVEEILSNTKLNFEFLNSKLMKPMEFSRSKTSVSIFDEQNLLIYEDNGLYSADELSDEMIQQIKNLKRGSHIQIRCHLSHYKNTKHKIYIE